MEAKAIERLIPRLGEPFLKASELLLRTEGRVVVTGMGKPGIIGRKIAATLASTGTPSFFVHPAEATHGDLGMITAQDVVIAISNSGETEEITRLLATIKRIGSKLIAMTGRVRSTLARHADVILDVSVDEEAPPMGLAPSSSTTATLAMGDALALTLLERKGFKVEDFALFHPGGTLGKKLLKVRDLMRTGRANPVVDESTIVKEALFAITQARAGSCTIVNKKGGLVGIFTDGDLRRRLRSGEQILDRPVREVATLKPVAIDEDALAVEALRLLEDKKIDELPVLGKKGRVTGLLDVQDLLRAGLI